MDSPPKRVMTEPSPRLNVRGSKVDEVDMIDEVVLVLAGFQSAGSLSKTTGDVDVPAMGATYDGGLWGVEESEWMSGHVESVSDQWLLGSLLADHPCSWPDMEHE